MLDINPPLPRRLPFGACRQCGQELPEFRRVVGQCMCGHSTCHSCAKCRNCDERVCPDCGVDISKISERYIVCAKCYPEALAGLPTEMPSPKAAALQKTLEQIKEMYR